MRGRSKIPFKMKNVKCKMQNGIRWLVGTLLVVMLLSGGQVWAWGPVTHTAINRQAGPHLGEEFVMGGHSPDMIALYHITKNSSRYDYAHNPFGGEKEPVFGKKAIETFQYTKHRERYTESDLRFAYGWSGHQLADSLVHGRGGYSTTKETFSRLPAEFRENLNHGAAELMVDAIVLKEVFQGNVSLFVTYHTDLIHEAAVRFYNDGNGQPINRHQIISCQEVERLTYRWEGWLQTSVYLAELSTLQPWFTEAKTFYADYLTPYRNSISVVKDFLSLAFPFVCSETAYGTEESPQSSYYRFVMEVSEEAKRLGGGKITRESFRQALKNVTKRELSSEQAEEVKIWAKFMEELYLKDNKSYEQVIKNVEKYAAEQDEDGDKSDFVPWLLLGVAAALAGFAIGWLIRIVKGGERGG